MAETNSASTAQKSARAIGEVVIEVVADANENVFFPPLQDRLRGRWDTRKLPIGDTSADGLLRMPTIPGLYLRVDPRTKTVEMSDPLALPQNARLLAEVSQVCESIPGLGNRVRPRQGFTKQLKTDDEVATWLYWLWRLTSQRMAEKVRGIDLTLDDLQAAYPEANIRKNWYDSTSYGKSSNEALAEQVAP